MKNTPIIIGAVVLILGVGYLVTNNAEEPTTATQKTTTEDVSETEAVVTEGASATEEPVADEVATAEEASTADAAPGVYTTYDADTIAQSDAEHILLFFHATWCPSCKALDADIVANADSIPAGVEIYKVDYDTSTALKRQYGVTTQHSIIEITASGEALSSISHPLTLEGVLATI